MIVVFLPNFFFVEYFTTYPFTPLTAFKEIFAFVLPVLLVDFTFTFLTFIVEFFAGTVLLFVVISSIVVASGTSVVISSNVVSSVVSSSGVKSIVTGFEMLSPG